MFETKFTTMKKILSLFLLTFLSFSLFSQLPAALKDASTLLWYGLDYTNTYFIDTEEFSDPELNLHDYFDQWNQVFVDEQKKYNLKNTFDVKEVIMKTEQVKEFNSSIELTGKITKEEHQIPYEEIKNIISKYTFEDQYGIAVIGIVESLDKNEKKASAYFTFVNLENMEIIYIKWMTGECGGAGFRNYWINPFADMLEQFYDAFRS